MADTPDVGSLDMIKVILARAGTDSALKAQLLAGGANALRALGVGVPDGVEVRFVQDTVTVRHFVIPAPAGSAELSDADLDKVAGGFGAPVQMMQQQMGPRPGLELEGGGPTAAPMQMGRRLP